MTSNSGNPFYQHSATYSTQDLPQNNDIADAQYLEADSADNIAPSEGYSEPDASEVEHKDQYEQTYRNSIEEYSPQHGPQPQEKQHQPVLSRVTNWWKNKQTGVPDPSTYEHAASSASSVTSETEKPDPAYKVRGHDDIEDQQPPVFLDEARQLVRTLTEKHFGRSDGGAGYTPAVDRYEPDYEYVPTPKQYKPSAFAAILQSKLNNLHTEISTQRDSYGSPKHDHSKSTTSDKQQSQHNHSQSPDSSGLNSGAATPLRKLKWYDEPKENHMAELLMRAAMSSTGPGMPGTSAALPKSAASKSTERLSSAIDFTRGKKHKHQRAESSDSNNELITEVADIIARRNYLTKLCGLLMKYGAPTHRMEAYLSASSKRLSIEADFLYMPGAMICTFIDHSILSNNVEVVRKTGGLDFARLKDTFNVYKCVIHKKYTAAEGIMELEKIERRPDRHSELFRILMFGLASVTAGPFSFNTRPIDFIPILVLGCVLGFMQVKVVPKSEQFSNVFEVFACVMFAFISRAIGSIKWGDGNYVFCFSGVAQSSIAMILPGFLVLNSALELQGKNMVSGSVRMIYAIIYVLFLGFGLLIGTTVFGLIKKDAVESVTCQVPDWFAPEYNYKLLYTRFVWAPLFACCVALIYQAKWRQLPVMALIAVAGHQANYWISTQLSSNIQVANAIGAFVIGCLANLYSRLFHGLAAAAMLPAIYCQVPGGLAASGSLVAGVVSSSQITGNSSSVSVVNNGTQGFVAAQNDPNSVYGGTIYNAGYGMVQVSIGISVGLYLSALVVYPFGKRRSGLFSF